MYVNPTIIRTGRSFCNNLEISGSIIVISIYSKMLYLILTNVIL